MTAEVGLARAAGSTLEGSLFSLRCLMSVTVNGCEVDLIVTALS